MDVRTKLPEVRSTVMRHWAGGVAA